MAAGGGGDAAAPPVSQALIKLVHQAKTTIDPDDIGALRGASNAAAAALTRAAPRPRSQRGRLGRGA